MSKVILQGYILVSESELRVVKQELVTHSELTKQEPGCIKFDVTQDKSNPNKFHVYEEFTNQDAFTHHQDRVKNSYWGIVTKNVSRHYQINNS